FDGGAEEIHGGQGVTVTILVPVDAAAPEGEPGRRHAEPENERARVDVAATPGHAPRIFRDEAKAEHIVREFTFDRVVKLAGENRVGERKEVRGERRSGPARSVEPGAVRAYDLNQQSARLVHVPFSHDGRPPGDDRRRGPIRRARVEGEGSDAGGI